MYMCGFSSRSKFVTTKDSNDVRLDFFFFFEFYVDLGRSSAAVGIPSGILL